MDFLRKIAGLPIEFKFKVQVFKRGETFDQTFYDGITAHTLEQAKNLMLLEYGYTEADYNISYEPGNGYTQMTVIEKDLPGAER